MHRLFYPILLCLLAVAGCNGLVQPDAAAPSTIENRHFVMVKAGPNDSLVSLARSYLKDGGKAWQIAAYNGIDAVAPGQQVVIPLQPLNPNGIYIDGIQTVPVLFYPRLTSAQTDSKAVTAEAFQRQMRYLNVNGFVTVTLDQFYAFLSQGDQLPPLSVIVTFDTTHSWAYEVAYPILSASGMKAAFFVRPEEVGEKDRLTWRQLAEMTANGMDIGLYGPVIKPPDKEDVKAYFDAIEKKFSDPKRSMAKRIERPCRYFAFAEGTSNDLIISILKKHGFRIGFTRKGGANPFYADNFKIRRSIILGSDTMEKFRQYLITFRSLELK